MTSARLYSTISKLNPSLINEVNDFVEFLKSKQIKDKIKERKFGCAKGFFTLKDDFDSELHDFQEYM